MSKNEEEKDMINVQERLDKANKKVDSVIDDIWAQSEANLKRLEEDYKKRTEGRNKD